MQALDRLIELKARKEELQKGIKKYEDCDPEVLAQTARETKQAVEGANRWTDNIFALHSWITKKFPSVSLQDLNKQFGIPDDLDYVQEEKGS